ncbi:uncharacterized protein LOC121734583 isoform X2 [Aricia agestis]|uniref:uncharacterized protein LOC121734583 isoform X2 n=1 Tax=Aricia agestis TaxID=91739 RepID=UPI001C201C14|nr:uncharacterized protein LOC121734583 isoform X2 [Aricia agestis]XP_041981097.1 uncharacterized protein LOC121734583 isoform X2 [Aricia agestis]
MLRLPIPGDRLLRAMHTIHTCVGYIIAGSWNLPRHRQRELEDNLISMTAVMFSALSAVSNAVALAGVTARRPGCLQLALVFNSVFILCIFLVAIVTCLFSPELAPYMKEPGNIALVVLLLIGGAVFSMYYLMVINSLYRKMKMSYSETLPM